MKKTRQFCLACLVDWIDYRVLDLLRTASGEYKEFLTRQSERCDKIREEGLVHTCDRLREKK